MDRTSYEALRESAAWIDMPYRGKIRVTGDDRARLLHSMCTNHIQNLMPGSGCYVFFLTAQGRIIADANIFCMPDYLLIDTEPEAKQILFDHLEKYIIADDVTLHDFTTSYGSISLEGPQAEALLKELDIPAAHVPFSIAGWSHSEIAHVTYTGRQGYSFFVPSEHKEELAAKFTAAGAPQASIEEADVVRLENGRARYGVDITDTTLPQETQISHAVHPSKGCYLGQEIVERVRSRGHVNKVLSSLEIESEDVPASGTRVDHNGKDVGAITSAAFSPASNRVVAIAMLRSEALNGPLTVAGAPASVRQAAALEPLPRLA